MQSENKLEHLKVKFYSCFFCENNHNLNDRKVSIENKDIKLINSDQTVKPENRIVENVETKNQGS